MVGVLVALWGAIFTSLCIVTVERKLLYNGAETRSISMLDDLCNTEELELKTARLILHMY